MKPTTDTATKWSKFTTPGDAAAFCRIAAHSPHTPGTWAVIAPNGDGGDYAVLSQNVNAGGNFYVATLPNGEHAEAKANAALIAAAPDLLEALELTLAHYVSFVNSGDGGHWNPETEEHVIAARAAIAKASQKQP